MFVIYDFLYVFFTLYRAKMNRKQNIKNINFFPKILFFDNIWISGHLRPIVSKKHK